MNKALNILIAIIISLIFSGTVLADIKSDIVRCIEISNNKDRLNCFDAAAQYYNSQSGSTTELPALKSPLSQINQAPTVEPKIQPLLPDPVEAFGQESTKALKSIESHIIGEFKGWEKGIKLKLENGQVWKVTSRKSGYKRMTNPKITITRGMMGSFDAKVEGFKPKVKVKRIK